MKLVIYTNILTPYRKYFYDLLHQICSKNGDSFQVLVMADSEPNRTWKYEELKSEYTTLLRNNMFCRGETYIHFNRGLVKILKKTQPDIVICAGSYLCPGVWKIAKLRNKLRYKCLYWSESHLKEVKQNGSAKVFIREILRQQVYKLFDGFWYAGKLSREFCEKYARIDARYYFVPNLIEEEKYAIEVDALQKKEIRNRLAISDEKVVLICPARLSPVKGIIEYLDIMQKSLLKDRIVMLIAGEGELKEQIISKASAIQIDVRLLGQKTQTEMMELYMVSDIFLLPSLSDPNPLTCIEALWAKLPMLISEHCGNSPEVVIDGKNGYVFSYADKSKAVEFLDTMLGSDQKWRIAAGEVSRKIAEELYSSDGASRRIIRDMENLIHME